jgi:hypothetical protein
MEMGCTREKAQWNSSVEYDGGVQSYHPCCTDPSTKMSSSTADGHDDALKMTSSTALCLGSTDL